jgi:NADPH-dependent 2,4-dienoyl-CoA reductase/sulfur reductase-like enzyme
MAARNVIVGGGPAAIYAMETLRALDPEAGITLISDEPAYSRMALPYWLAGRVPEAQVMTGSGEYYARLAVETRLGERVASLQPDANSLTLESGETLAYDNLLLALGSRPQRPPIPGADAPGVATLWTLADTRQVLDALPDGGEVCLVGAGFIGFIVLNALFKRGCRLSVVEVASHVLPRMLDQPAAALVEAHLTQKNVALYTGTSVQGIEGGAGKKTVRLQDGRTVSADVVILATGVTPNVELAVAAGLKTRHGIVVDDRCRTSVRNIYAGGDCAAGPDRLTGEPSVHAIQPTAVDHGRVAGANMAGQHVRYPGSLSMNILDVAGLQCASFGKWGGEGLEVQLSGRLDAGLLRKLVWDGSTLVGAIFVGPMHDVCMLNDVGMAKGFIQTKTDLGNWKPYLLENPADLRRPYIATGVPEKLIDYTTLGCPSDSRDYRATGECPGNDPGAFHPVFAGTRGPGWQKDSETAVTPKE